MTMTLRRHRFVAQYLVDLNAAQAAIRAGFSKNAAKEYGQFLLTCPDVAEAIEKAQAKVLEKAEIEAVDVIRELVKLGFSNMLDYMRINGDGDAYVDLSNLTREQAAAISEITVEDYVEGRGDNARDVRKVKFKLADKRAALVDIGRHFALFTDNVRVAGPDGGPVQIEEKPIDRINRRLDRLQVIAGTDMVASGSNGSGT